MGLRLRTQESTFRVEYREKESADGKTREGEILATFIVRPLTPTRMKKVLSHHKIVEWDSPAKDEKKERFESYDFLGITFDRVRKTIIDWEGILDEKGNPLPCTDENKLLVFELNIEIINYVLVEAAKLGTGLEAEKEAETKNLSAGRRGEEQKG